MKVGCFYCQVVQGHDAFEDIEHSLMVFAGKAHVLSDMGLKLE